MNKTFNQEYLSEFLLNPAQIKLRKLAIKYLQETENYDQRICIHKNARGIAIPITPQERGRCMSNAFHLYNELKLEAEILGFDGAAFRKEIQFLENREKYLDL